VRIGPALESLAQLSAEHAEAFDLVFIDADKRNTPEYFTTAVDLSHPGSLIVVDNVWHIVAVWAVWRFLMHQA